MYQTKNCLDDNYCYNYVDNYLINTLYSILKRIFHTISKSEKLFYTKTELLKYSISLLLAKIGIFGSRLVSNSLIF